MNAREIIDRLRAIRERRAPIGYDLEGSLFVSCQAFAESPSRAFCIVTDQLGENANAIWAEIVAVLEDPAIPKWTWNAHHELAVLKLAHGITLRGFEDGMALWFEKWPELPKGLKYAASILTRQPCWTEGIAFDEEDGNVTGRGEDFYRYNATDAARTLELALHPQLAPVATSERYALRKRLVEALTWASLKGIRYDTHAAASIRASLEPRLWAAQAEVDRIAGVVLPANADELLCAAAKRWCHAVKLRKFVMPRVQATTLTPTQPPACAEPAGPEALVPGAPLPTEPGQYGVLNESQPQPAPPAPGQGGLGSSSVGTTVTIRAESQSAAIEGTVRVRKRARKKAPPPPPEPLTWKSALDIAKLGGADAILKIQANYSNMVAGTAISAAGELADLLGIGVNVKSTKQVIALLDRLKLPKVFRRGERGNEGARTKDADVLLDLYLRTSHPVTVALLCTIALRTQLQELDRKLDSDGRIRCRFTSCGTETDRTTSSAWLTGSGGNLQTVPREPVNFRVCYVPDDGPAPGDEP